MNSSPGAKIPFEFRKDVQKKGNPFFSKKEGGRYRRFYGEKGRNVLKGGGRKKQNRDGEHGLWGRQVGTVIHLRERQYKSGPGNKRC